MKERRAGREDCTVGGEEISNFETLNSYLKLILN
jgi:hypothetical protein